MDIYSCLTVVLVAFHFRHEFIHLFIHKDGCICSVPGSGLHAGDTKVGKDVAFLLREQMSVVDTELPTQHPFPFPLPYSKQNPDFVQVAIFLLDPTLCSSGPSPQGES